MELGQQRSGGSQAGWDGENRILSNTGSTVRPVFSSPPSLEITLPTVWPRQRSQAFREEDTRLRNARL